MESRHTKAAVQPTLVLAQKRIQNRRIQNRQIFEFACSHLWPIHIPPLAFKPDLYNRIAVHHEHGFHFRCSPFGQIRPSEKEQEACLPRMCPSSQRPRSPQGIPWALRSSLRHCSTQAAGFNQVQGGPPRGRQSGHAGVGAWHLMW